MKLIQDLGMKYPTSNSKQRYRYGIYKCPICNNYVEVMMKSVIQGKSNKCRSCASLKHGKVNSNIYKRWTSIKNRCYNKNSNKYESYGARGITVCDEWKNDFIAFYNWSIDNGYNKNLTIDRIDNNKGYSPDNCRWVDMSIQQQNKRIQKNNTTGYTGVGFNKSRNKFVVQFKVNNKDIYLGGYNNISDAVFVREKYIIENKLKHTKNMTNEEYETMLSIFR